MKTVLTFIREALSALATVPKTPHAVAIGAQLKACASNAEAHIATELATEAAKAVAAVATPTLAELQAANGALQAKLNALAPPAPPAQPSSSGPLSNAPLSTGSKTDKGQSAKGQSAKGSLGALAALLFAPCALLFAPCALLFAPCASAQPANFNITNVLSAQSATAGTILAGFPTNVPVLVTNSVFTNTVGQGTGGAVSLMNADNICLVFKAYICTNVGGGTPTTNSVAFTLIRSAAANSPQVNTGTNLFTGNGTNLQSTDWETWSNTVPALGLITVPLNLTTGLLTWSTNLDARFIGAQRWLGVGQIQINATNCFLTNVNLTAAHKILPIRYP